MGTKNNKKKKVKRSRLDILIDILRVIKQERSIPPTKLMRKSNLSFDMFKDYALEIKEKGFIKIEEKEDRKYYLLSEQGWLFLEKYK